MGTGVAPKSQPIEAEKIFARSIIDRQAIRALAMTVVILGSALIASLFFNYWMFSHVPTSGIVAVTSNLEVVPLKPLSDPVWSDEQITNWSGRAVTETYSFDFANYRTQITNSGAKYFTTEGFELLGSELKASALIKLVTDEKYVVSTVLDGVPIVKRNAVWQDKRVWEVEVPVIMSLLNSRISVTKRFLITLVVIRTDAIKTLQPVGIMQWRQKEQ